MKPVFLGEEGYARHGSIGMGANASPPSEGVDVHFRQNKGGPTQVIDAWLEIWDYAGGCSFRGFVGGNGADKSLFAFFDTSVVSRDLKQALMALMELAETVFAVSQIVICLDRSMPEADSQTFHKSLQWVGFDLITLDTWSHSLDTTSDRWLFLGMEV